MNAIPLVLAAVLLPFPHDEEAGAGQAGAQEDSVLVRYDLSDVVPSVDREGYRESLLCTTGNRYVRHDRANLEDLYTSDGMDVVVDLLQNVLGAEFEYEGRRIDMSGEDELLVLAPQAIQQKVARILDALEGGLGGAVQVRVDVVTTTAADGPGGLPDQGVVDAAQLEGMLASMGRSGTRATYDLRLSPGRTGALNLMRQIPLIVDYDVEIAQGAVIHDPLTGYAEEGMRLMLRGSPARGGVALTVVYGSGDAVSDGPTGRKVEINSLLNKEQEGSVVYADGPVLFETLDVLCRSAAFSTFLPDGKALLFSSRADLGGEKSRQVVAIRKAGGGLEPYHEHAIEGSRRQLLMVNAEYFDAPRTAVHGPRENEDHNVGDVVELDTEVRGDDALFLFDWMDSHFSVWRTLGPWVVCVYDPSWDGDAAARLEELMGQWASDMRVSDVSVTLRSSGRGAPVSWRLPVRIGSEAAALLAVTGNQLADYDVEVAQFAATPDPVIFPTFHGMAFRLRVGRSGVNVRAMANVRAGPRRTVDIGSPMMTELERAVSDRLFVEEHVAVRPGGPAAVLGDSSEQGSGPSLSLEVRMN